MQGPALSEELSSSHTPLVVKNETNSAVPAPGEAGSQVPEPTPTTVVPVFPEGSVPDRPATLSRSKVDSRHSGLTLLLLVVSTYASLLTLYLAYKILFERTHQLESLPDLKTVQQRGGRAAVPKPENTLPPGHVLKLGQTGRYGDIRVTPLRVTKGPLAFSHYSGDATRERAPSDPVLKLWLKFENVSETKTITPMDTTLMYFNRGIGHGEIASYNVIFPDTDLRKNKLPYYYHFDRIAADSEWSIVGQNANRALAPHETFETFVPSQENIEGLTGDLVWRIHIRKGHGPKTGNGVTTLIDVHFHCDDIQPAPV